MKLSNPLIRIPAKYGAIGATLVIILFYVLHFTDGNPLTDMNMFDFFILPIFLFFGMKEYRDIYNNKQLEFWQGMSTGFVVYVTLALITTLSLFLFLSVAAEQVFVDYVINAVAEVTNNRDNTIERMGEEAYLEALSKTESTTKLDLVFDYLLKKLIVGLMLTIMISVIMRRKPLTASGEKS